MFTSQEYTNAEGILIGFSSTFYPFIAFWMSDSEVSSAFPLAVVSTILMIPLVVTLALHPKKRRFPASAQLWFSVGVLIYTIGVDFSILDGGMLVYLSETSNLTIMPHFLLDTWQA